MIAPASGSQPFGGGDGRAMPSRAQIGIGIPAIALRTAVLTAWSVRAHSNRTKSGLATHSTHPQSAKVGFIWGMPTDYI